MLPTNRVLPHPGEILQDQFLDPMEIPQTKLAEKLGIPVQRINEIVNGKRGITPETAWLLSAAFGTSPQFWTNLQANHDLTKNRPAQLPKRIATGG